MAPPGGATWHLGDSLGDRDYYRFRQLFAHPPGGCHVAAVTAVATVTGFRGGVQVAERPLAQGGVKGAKITVLIETLRRTGSIPF